MSDINMLGTSSNIPDGLKFPSVGTKHIMTIDSIQEVPVREFVGGRPAEQLYFQNQKPVRQSELNLQLPYQPIPAFLIIGRQKDGTEASLRLEGERLKAARKTIREKGIGLQAGGKIAIEYHMDDPNSKGQFPKKLFRVSIQAPKDL